MEFINLLIKTHNICGGDGLVDSTSIWTTHSVESFCRNLRISNGLETGLIPLSLWFM